MSGKLSKLMPIIIIIVENLINYYPQKLDPQNKA